MGVGGSPVGGWAVGAPPPPAPCHLMPSAAAWRRQPALASVRNAAEGRRLRTAAPPPPRPAAPPRSGIVDADCTQVVDGTLVKIYAWCAAVPHLRASPRWCTILCMLCARRAAQGRGGGERRQAGRAPRDCRQPPPLQPARPHIGLHIHSHAPRTPTHLPCPGTTTSGATARGSSTWRAWWPARCERRARCRRRTSCERRGCEPPGPALYRKAQQAAEDEAARLTAARPPELGAWRPQPYRLKQH